MHVISQPKIPFWGQIPDGVHSGTVINIDGYVPHHSDKFGINLVIGKEISIYGEHQSSIAFHFNPRINEKYIVLNSRHHKSWGEEDLHRHNYQFHKGSNFSITIHVENEYYKVLVNGSHFCNFYHRMPYHEVGVLWIDGCVNIHRIEYRRDYKPSYEQTPYLATNAHVQANYTDGQQHHQNHHHY